MLDFELRGFEQDPTARGQRLPDPCGAVRLVALATGRAPRSRPAEPGCGRSVPEELARVHRLAVDLDLVVQVWTGGAPGVAGKRDHVAPLDLLTRLHLEFL